MTGVREKVRDALLSDAAVTTCDHGTQHWLTAQDADRLAVVALQALGYWCDNVCVFPIGHDGECR